MTSKRTDGKKYTAQVETSHQIYVHRLLLPIYFMPLKNLLKCARALKVVSYCRASRTVSGTLHVFEHRDRERFGLEKSAPHLELFNGSEKIKYGKNTSNTKSSDDDANKREKLKIGSKNRWEARPSVIREQKQTACCPIRC